MRQRQVSFPRSIREQFVLTDSSAFLALADDNDQNHDLVVGIHREAHLRGAIFFTTDLMVVEAHALILSALGHSIARRWLRELEMEEVEVTARDKIRAREIIFQYTDKDFSLCDACSFAVMERLGVSQAFTFDAHFAQYGWTALR